VRADKSRGATLIRRAKEEKLTVPWALGARHPSKSLNHEAKAGGTLAWSSTARGDSLKWLHGNGRGCSDLLLSRMEVRVSSFVNFLGTGYSAEGPSPRASGRPDSFTRAM